eukprot:353378-Chlamydomonas_euryale.AAC.2
MAFTQTRQASWGELHMGGSNQDKLEGGSKDNGPTANTHTHTCTHARSLLAAPPHPADSLWDLYTGRACPVFRMHMYPLPPPPHLLTPPTHHRVSAWVELVAHVPDAASAQPSLNRDRLRATPRTEAMGVVPLAQRDRLRLLQGGGGRSDGCCATGSARPPADTTARLRDSRCEGLQRWIRRRLKQRHKA